MVSLLLAVIYLSFISLGLPDSLLGSVWPSLYGPLGVPVSYAGIVSMIITCGTVTSSLLSDRLTRRLGTGLLTALSVLMTAVALFGFSVSNAFWHLCVWAVPYGLGAGAVDAALNNYVALHYRARHMNWLHCFWGVGASLGPYIMGACLAGRGGWHGGYRAVSLIQAGLTALLLCSLPLWKKPAQSAEESRRSKPLGLSGVLKIPGVLPVLGCFFGYCAVEVTGGLWAGSYLTLARGVDAVAAARYTSMFYLGITLGRFVCGFAADALGDGRMVRLGLGVILLGLLLLLPRSLPVPVAVTGLVLTGLGCAPIYPALLHETPRIFGAENSQAVIGIQMASAYAGSTFAPPLFGLVSRMASVALYPYYILLFLVLMMVLRARLSKKFGV